MFGIDGPEFFVILLVLIVVVGPKDLPKMLRTMAKAIAYVRSTANEFRHQFDDAMKQAELDNLQKTLSNISDFNPDKKLTGILNPMHDIRGDISDNFDVNTTHHKLEKDQENFECDQNKTNEDLDVPVVVRSFGSVSVTSKDKVDAS
ncbi:Sec-independent protein translocase protein TatB [Bartonella koehlerae]|uniref:Twin arginine-targeting protein translocase TatB n=1 Tax=Bartonella koehlerae C-29 TaxID=1134510 RepID=A0A067W6E4_9HYPH|nr:Sec-independent protein translocase protein TatB [Bartonella koehlerae]KEC55500.1 twin arginine-targeting protein translocase TatB [Bartonella koehlerae C-29]